MSYFCDLREIRDIFMLLLCFNSTVTITRSPRINIILNLISYAYYN